MIGTKSSMIILQDRDRHLLRELSLMRLVDREQAKRVAPFGSTTRANVRLLGLVRAGLLRRFFLGTVGGTRKALYALSPAGAKAVEVPYRGLRRAHDETVVTDFFVAHQLRINDVYCLVTCQPIPAGGARFVGWQSFYEPLESALSLIPDGYFEIATPDKTIAAFIEVDRGHESLTVWLKKVREYLRYALSGNFEARFHQKQFRVLAIAESERRMKSLKSATAE